MTETQMGSCLTCGDGERLPPAYVYAIDVVIGELGPAAPPEYCNGLALPVVVFDQIYSFDRNAIISALPRPKDVAEKDDGRFRTVAGEVFDRLTQMADNAGATDEHRALNYLAVRYPRIYAAVADGHERDLTLRGRGRAAVAAERHAPDRRCRGDPVASHHPRAGETVCPGGRDRGIPVPAFALAAVF